MTKDFIYENAPLVEVIVEIHWSLQPLTAIPNAAMDPHFNALSTAFRTAIESEGFAFVEQLIPKEVPLELLPRKPVFRIRKEKNTWPVYQLGPGLFTANMVPPYNGWKGFRKIVECGVKLLYQSYPIPEKFLTLDRVELRYLDAFTKRHDMRTYMQFLNEYSRVSLRLPQEISNESVVEGGEVQILCEARFPARKPKGSQSIIKMGPGQAQNENAVLVDFSIRSQSDYSPQSSEEILVWLDEAHEVVRMWFAHFTTDELKEKMGPIKELAE